MKDRETDIDRARGKEKREEGQTESEKKTGDKGRGSKEFN